jgi:hypothetical protein
MRKSSHQPGHAYKKNFNKAPSGRLKIGMKRAHKSRSKSRG